MGHVQFFPLIVKVCKAAMNTDLIMTETTCWKSTGAYLCKKARKTANSGVGRFQIARFGRGMGKTRNVNSNLQKPEKRINLFGSIPITYLDPEVVVSNISRQGILLNIFILFYLV